MNKTFIFKMAISLLAPMVMFSDVIYEGKSKDVQTIALKAGLKSLDNGKKDLVFNSKKGSAIAKIYVSDPTINRNKFPGVPLRIDVNHGGEMVTATVDPQILEKNKTLYVMFQNKKGAILYDASKDIAGKKG